MDVLNILFPNWASSRASARHKILVLKRYYDAAQPTQYKKQQRQNGSAQLSTQNGAVKIRDNARNLDENHDITIGIFYINSVW